MKTSKNNHNRSLWILTGIYLLAIGFGTLTYRLLPWTSPIWRMFAADLSATVIVWLFGVILENSSVYDPYWSVIPPLILAGWIWETRPDRWEGIALLSLVLSIWAIRLTRNWFKGWTDFSSQDWRYTMIRESHPHLWFLANLVGINLMPTIIVFLQLAGIHRFIENAPEMNGWIVGGTAVAFAAVFVQSLADHQMESFRERNREGQKRCIEEGLWRVSRHPNYFGEVALWWGIWMISSAGMGIFDWFFLAPVLMTCLFLFISIPMMEKKILISRPEYRDYQRHVSMLVPFFRRNPAEPTPEDEKTRL